MHATDPNRAGRRELNSIRAKNRQILVLSFVFSIFVNLLMLTGPLFMLQVYDRVLGSRSQETLVALVVLVAALYALMGVLDYARGRVLARYGARFQSELDERVFKSGLEPRPVGDKTALSSTRDVEAIQSLYASPALTAIMDVPFTPLFLLAIFIFHPLLGWVALGGGAFLIMITVVNQFSTQRKLKEAQIEAERANQFREHALQASDVIRSQGMVDPVTTRWVNFRTAALKQSISTADLTGTFTSLSKSLRLFMQSAILAVGAYLVLRGEVTAGAMIAASILMGRALAPVEQLLARWPQIQRARIGWASLVAFLSNDERPDPHTRLPQPPAKLTVKDISVVSQIDRETVLRALNFEVKPGEALGVIGKSGAGKTTLAKVLLGLVEPAMGEVRLGNALLSQYSAEDLGRHIGYLPQDPMLVDGSIAENIARMSLEPDSEAVVRAAHRAKAHELITGLSKGYDTPVNGNRVPLSGGQKQRVALARALYGDPVLLVLDEPNSALDMEGSEALNAAVRTLKAEGKAVVIMTHRPMAISECDTLLVIDKGHATAHGPRDDVLRAMVKNVNGVQQVVTQKGAS